MKCLPLFCAALALTFTFAPGCKKQNDNDTAPANGAAPAKDPNEVVASVDGAKYLRKDLDDRVGKMIKASNVPEEQTEQAREYFEMQLISSFIQRTLLENEVKKEGITVTAEDRAELMARIEPMLKERNTTLELEFQKSPFGEESARAEFEQSIAFDKLIKVKILSQVTIDDADVTQIIEQITAKNAAAEEHNKKMESKEAKRAKAEDIKKQLDAGADFAELAKAHSSCPSKESGGALGTFQREMMVKPFSDAAFTQEVGKVGDIVETQFGYHLILVTAKNPATAATGDTPATPETVAASHILFGIDREQPLEPVPTAEEARTALKEQRGRPMVQEYINALREKAKIESIIPLEGR